MSLINQVLKDLEQRRGDEDSPATITEDLCFQADAHPRPAAKGILRRVLLSAGLLALLSSSAYGAWHLWKQQRASATAEASAAETTEAPGETKQAQVEQAPTPDRPDAGPGHTTKATQLPPQAEQGTNETHGESASPRRHAEQTNDAKESRPAASKSVARQKALGETHRASRAAPKPEQQPARATPKKTAEGGTEQASQTVQVASARPAAIEKRRVPLTPKQRAELAYQQAYKAMQAGHHNQARKRLRSALASYPEHIKARTLLAGSYMQNGRWAAAVVVLKKGLEMAPGQVSLRKLYARALMQQGQEKGAIAALQQQMPAVSADPEYHALLAALYQRTDQHDAAVASYLEVLKVRPHRGAWWMGLGISLEAADKYAQAQQAYRKAREAGGLSDQISAYIKERLLALEVRDPAPE